MTSKSPLKSKYHHVFEHTPKIPTTIPFTTQNMKMKFFEKSALFFWNPVKKHELPKKKCTFDVKFFQKCTFFSIFPKKCILEKTSRRFGFWDLGFIFCDIWNIEDFRSLGRKGPFRSGGVYARRMTDIDANDNIWFTYKTVQEKWTKGTFVECDSNYPVV